MATLLAQPACPLEVDASHIDKPISLQVKQAMTGETMMQLKVLSSDTVAELRRAFVQQSAKIFARFEFVFKETVLSDELILKDVGVCDGDAIDVVRLSFQCLTASYDGSARMWNGETGECQHHFETDSGPDEFRQMHRAFCAPDSRVILTLTLSGIGQLWDVRSGTLMRTLNAESVSARLAAVAFAPDGTALLGGFDDGTSVIYCARTGQALHMLCGHGDDVRAVAFAPSGDVMATADGDGVVCLWEKHSATCLFRLADHQDAVVSLDFSCDGSLLAAASMDTTVSISDTHLGRRVSTLAGQRKYPMTFAQFSPICRETVLSCSGDGSVSLWCTTTGACFQTIHAQKGAANLARFSPDGGRLLIASASNELAVFDTHSGEQVLALSGHSDWIRHASFSACGLLIITASSDGIAKVWSAVKGECIRTLNGHSKAVMWVEFVEH